MQGDLLLVSVQYCRLFRLCMFVCQTEGYKNALRRLLKHWPFQKTTDLFKTQWYAVCASTCMFHCVVIAHGYVCVTWCTATSILSHQPSLILMFSQMLLCMVDCMIYCYRVNGVATVMNLLSVWCTGVFAGGREVNTPTRMATFTLMMKFPPHFQTQAEILECRWWGGEEDNEEVEMKMEEEEEEGRRRNTGFGVVTASHCWRGTVQVCGDDNEW